MNIDGIIIIDASSGLSLFSRLESIDDNLFSGFLSAISSFSKEMSLGGISSFTTEEKSVYLIARHQILVSLITSNEYSFSEIYSLGYLIGEKFEQDYDLSKLIAIDSEMFQGFNEQLDLIIKEKAKPFIVKVAEFVKKEFGGEISLEPKLINNDEKLIKIDIVSDRGEKKNQGFFGMLAKKMLRSFSEEVTFIKVIEGIAGRGEVSEFLDLMKTFGKLHHKKDDKSFPFFPAKAVIIAHEYSPTVFDDLNNLSTYSGKKGIAGTHISPDAGMRGAPKTMKCLVELWKWNEDNYPERIFS